MFLVRGVVRGIFPLAPSHFSNGKLSFLSKKNIKKHIFSNIFVQKTYKNMFFSGILGLPVCPVIFKTGIPVLKITGQTGTPKNTKKHSFFHIKTEKYVFFLTFFWCFWASRLSRYLQNGNSRFEDNGTNGKP